MLKPLTPQMPVTAKGDPAHHEFVRLLDEYRRKLVELEARIVALEP